VSTREVRAMKWIGYGLQGVGGLMAVTGLGVFAFGKLVEHVATRGDDGDETVDLPGTDELAVL
jgi:hypothetical protein